MLTGQRLGSGKWTLKALQDEAAKRSSAVALARAQYESARASIVTAGTRPGPTVAFTPQVVTPFTSWIAGTYGVDFDWVFETAGKRGHRLEAAHAAVRGAAAQVIDTTWQAKTAVRKAYLELHAADSKVKILEEAIGRQEELLKFLGTQMAAGAISRSSVLQPRLLLTQLRFQSTDSTKSAGLARASLAAALGMGVTGLDGADFSFTDFSKDIRPVTAPRHAALTRRADILTSLANYAGAEAALHSEIAKQYPDLHLNPGYSLDSGQNKWTLGSGVALPILNRNQGPIAEAEAKRQEAGAQFDTVQSKVLAECDHATAAIAGSRLKLAAARKLLASQAEQISMEARGVSAGESDQLILLSAKVEQATARTYELDAEIELQSAFAELEAATQSPVMP